MAVSSSGREADTSWWHNPALNKRSSVPRHSEINDHLARRSVGILGFRTSADRYDRSTLASSQFSHEQKEKRTAKMNQAYTALIKKDAGWWIS